MPIPPMKHVLDDILSIPAANVTMQTINIAVGTLNPDPYTTNNAVKAGSIVTKISILLDINADVLNDATVVMPFDWYVGFNINGAQTLPNPNAVGNSHLKNQIFHQDQGLIMIPPAGGTSMHNPQIWRLVINVPKTYRQINEGDVIVFNIIKSAMSSTDLYIKFKAIYLEYYP